MAPASLWRAWFGIYPALSAIQEKEFMAISLRVMRIFIMLALLPLGILAAAPAAQQPLAARSSAASSAVPTERRVFGSEINAVTGSELISDFHLAIADFTGDSRNDLALISFNFDS